MLTLSKHAFCGAALKYTNIINSLVLDGAALKRANVTKTRVRNICTKHPPINELFILIDAIIINGGRKKHMYKCFISASLKLTDFSAKIGPLKNQLKKSLILNQHRENPNDWTVDDYDLSKL